MPSKEVIKILFIGDIVSKPGRRAVSRTLPILREKHHFDYIFANGENLAGGSGMTLDTYEEMKGAGIDYFTSGNHIWKNKSFIEYLDDEKVSVLRPENYPISSPGRGVARIGDVVLVNLLGRVFMPDDVDDPFSIANKIAKENPEKIIIIDFHAEATSEKSALGHYLDGKVAAVLGTHTHIETADEKILPGGTGYISDIGMCGPYDSVLGVKKEIIVEKFLTQLPKSHKVASGDSVFNAVSLEIDTKTKKCIKIKRIKELVSVN